jgi:8-oxo-dGTP diphosphatase
MIEFSVNQPEKDKKYIQRAGAYAVIRNKKDLIAVVKTETGYFLPGGGMETGELPELCLKRECLEEIGAEISILDNFARGNYYFYSTTLNIDMESLGYFFECKIDKFLETKTEVDHELIWMEANQMIEALYLDNQKEAIKIFKAKKV